jgi:hypothetical protein
MIGEHRLLACPFRLPAETHLPVAAAEPALSLPNGSAAESVAAPKAFGVEILEPAHPHCYDCAQ